MKMFPVLGERTVTFAGFDGKTYEIPKPGIGKIDELLSVTETAGRRLDALATDDSVTAVTVIAEARQAALAIIHPLFPEEIRREPDRLDYAALIDLVLYLAFGGEPTGDTDGDGPKTVRREGNKRPDLEFLTAKILHCFGGYTVTSLLAEPPSLFFALARLADRVRADDAIECHAAAFAAALHGSCRELLRVRGKIAFDVSDGDKSAPSAEQLRAAIELAGQYAASGRTPRREEAVTLHQLMRESAAAPAR